MNVMKKNVCAMLIAAATAGATCGVIRAPAEDLALIREDEIFILQPAERNVANSQLVLDLAIGNIFTLATFCPPWRKAQHAPAREPRPPETGRAYPLHTHTTTARACTERTVGAKSNAILDRCQYAYLNTDRSMGAGFDGLWGILVK